MLTAEAQRRGAFDNQHFASLRLRGLFPHKYLRSQVRKEDLFFLRYVLGVPALKAGNRFIPGIYKGMNEASIQQLIADVRTWEGE